jgi:fructosamine-3-kinase
MFSKQTNEFIAQELLKKLNIAVSSTRIDAVGGGSINDTYRLTVNDTYDFFLKVNKTSRYPALFEKE